MAGEEAGRDEGPFSLSAFLAGTPDAKDYGPFASAGVLRGSEGWGPAHTLPQGSRKCGWALPWDVGAPGEEGKPLGGA